VVRKTDRDTLAPIVFGPNGSGYKGKDKSHQDHAASSAVYDYGGSYTQLGRGRGRPAPDDDSDPDDIDDTPGGGDGPGRGGGGGPPGGERSSKPHHKMPRQISPVGGWGQEWKWACVSIACYLS